MRIRCKDFVKTSRIRPQGGETRREGVDVSTVLIGSNPLNCLSLVSEKLEVGV
jgi:hypothetical protein